MLVKILNTPLLTIVTKSSISDITGDPIRYVPGTGVIGCFIADTTYHPLLQWIQQLSSMYIFI